MQNEIKTHNLYAIQKILNGLVNPKLYQTNQFYSKPKPRCEDNIRKDLKEIRVNVRN